MKEDSVMVSIMPFRSRLTSHFPQLLGKELSSYDDELSHRTLLRVADQADARRMEVSKDARWRDLSKERAKEIVDKARREARRLHELPTRS